MTRRLVHIVCCLLLSGGNLPLLAAEQPELNFKIYSPAPSPQADAQPAETPAAKVETPAEEAKKPEDKSTDSMWSESATTAPAAPASTAVETPAAAPEAAPTSSEPADSGKTDKPKADSKLLQGYIRVVPSGTKIPIIMDTAIDSDTSQEGDEFAARTGEDLNIDGSTIVPAGSVIKGRIAQINPPKHVGRSGSVAFKFDTVTTPDNRQIPLVANLVARGGVVHARRGLKDLAIDTGTFMAPTALGLGIGVLAGGSGSSKVGRGGGALIGAGVGAAVGVVILCIKKGKRVDLRPGDELKIELAEDLRMPM